MRRRPCPTYGAAGDLRRPRTGRSALPARSSRKSASLRLATAERTRAESWSQRASTPLRGPRTDAWSPTPVRMSARQRAERSFDDRGTAEEHARRLDRIGNAPRRRRRERRRPRGRPSRRPPIPHAFSAAADAAPSSVASDATVAARPDVSEASRAPRGRRTSRRTAAFGRRARAARRPRDRADRGARRRA